MKSNKILGITIFPVTKSTVLEKILLYIDKPTGFFNIVSLNPENMVISTENDLFKKVIETAQIRIIDGVGIVLAGRMLEVEAGQRITGVDLMEQLIEMASDRRLRVLMIGGKDNLALRLAECYKERYPKAKFLGTIGINDIKNPSVGEERKIFSIVAAYKPHLMFVAFGSPDQELWLYKNRKRLDNVICMGVGGAFDFIGQNVTRAPVIFQKLGLEWLYRLVTQPWRWRRQLRLLKFLWLVILEFKKRLIK